MTFGMIAVGVNRLTSPAGLKQTAYSFRCRGKIDVTTSATLLHIILDTNVVSLNPHWEHAIFLGWPIAILLRNADRVSPQDTQQVSPTESSHPFPDTLLLFSSAPLKKLHDLPQEYP
jgi:hypothetical protein